MLQAALLSEREEAKLAVALEKQALEEARTARVKVGRYSSCMWSMLEGLHVHEISLGRQRLAQVVLCREARPSTSNMQHCVYTSLQQGMQLAAAVQGQAGKHFLQHDALRHVHCGVPAVLLLLALAAYIYTRLLLSTAAASVPQEREAFHAEVTGERRRLAEEAAATSRAAEEARANLLDLKGRLAEYEASAAAALRQARQEDERAAAVRAGVKAEQEQLAAAKKELEVR